MVTRLAAWPGLMALALLVGSSPATAQIRSYPDPFLDYVHPAGAQRGQTVKIELGGRDGLTGATRVIVDGPGGVSVSGVEPAGANTLSATLTVAPDAPLGRRRLRVVGGTNGLTNPRTFVVGRLPELVEAEPNNDPSTAQEVAQPAVVNGRMQSPLDVDWYRFTGKAGQPLVAAIQAQSIDALVRESFVTGYLDTSLELLDTGGKVLAAADDTLGLDPAISVTLPADGVYFVRVQSLSYRGAPSAVYRLTLGDVPYITSVFPPGGRRGETLEFRFEGLNLPADCRRTITLGSSRLPVEYLTLDGDTAPSQDLPVVQSDLQEIVVAERADDVENPTLMPVPGVANALFDRPGDEDAFRFTLKQGQGIVVSTMAQRHRRAAVDTQIELLDPMGRLVGENDDARLYVGQAWHDFEPHDSRFSFRATVEGEYRVRVREHSGAAGMAASYRLYVEDYGPDFHLFQWPDAVPIWGPGSTAALVAQVFAVGGLASDVEVTVEGLPEGWTGSTSVAPASLLGTYMESGYGPNVPVVITAPPDAQRGTVVPFRVVGRATVDGKLIEHEAQYLSLYGNSHNDRMFLRYSDGARAVVAENTDVRLETSIKELTAPVGGTVEIPLKLFRSEGIKGPLGIGVDGLTIAAGTGWRPPVTVNENQNELSIPLTLNPEWKPGNYPLIVSRAWAADLRAGRPGPCTSIIRLTITPAAK